MPYLKFPTKQEEGLAWDIVDALQLGLGESRKVTGLTAIINTTKHGPVSFFSEEPYMTEINIRKLTYTIIPKEEIDSKFSEWLLKSHPEYADEL